MNGTIRVANVRTHTPTSGERTYYVGRGRAPHGSESLQLGNPFKVGQGYARGEAVTAYRAYLRAQCAAKTGPYPAVLRLARELAAGQQITLLCWCAPASCHADVIAQAARGYAQRLTGGEPKCSTPDSRA